MREVSRGVVDVLRASGLRQTDRTAHDDGEPFVMPKEAEDTREDTAYSASESRDPTRAERRESDTGRDNRAGRGRASVHAGREQGAPKEVVSSEQAESGTDLMRGVERLTTAVLDNATLGGRETVTLTADAVGRSQEQASGEDSQNQLDGGEMVSERLVDTSADESGEQGSDELLQLTEANRRADMAREASRANAGRGETVDRAQAATTAVGQRIVTDQTSEESVEMGQGLQGDDDLIEEAAAEAFDEAQAIRDDNVAPDGPGVDVIRPRVQTAAQLFASPTPAPVTESTMPEGVGSTSSTQSLMEEIMVAQRGAAGGDRIGDSDAIIRVSEGAAGALQVKVKREGENLTLRVRAEDLAMRHVMAESLPELKQELQKANLVEGEIEVREDGLEDQMQSETTWDENQSARHDTHGDGSHETEGPHEPGQASLSPDVPTTHRHDGELHVVA